MTGARIEIRPEGADAAMAALAEAADRTEDRRGLFDAIGASVATSTRKRFEDEAGPDGNPWPASIRKMVLGGRTLTEIGTLSDSITHRAGDDRVEVGTDVHYAAIHQFGGTIEAKSPGGLRFRLPTGQFVRKAKVTIPARPFLGLDRADREEIAATAAEWLGSLLPGGGDAGE